jgi:hypothetical protein
MSFVAKKRLSTVPEEFKGQESLERLILKLKIHSRSENPEIFSALINCLTMYKKQNDEIFKFAANYDSFAGVESNGFRSFLKISEILTEKIDEEILKLEQDGQFFFI